MITPAEAAALPLGDRCEVLVVGGGTAGSAAAITAARAGADTLVVEQYGALGGTMALALVTPMMANHLDGQNLSRGLNLEILERAAALDPPPSGRLDDARWFNPMALPFVLDDLLTEAGGRVLFDTRVSEAIVDPSQTPPRVRGIVAENKDGRSRIEAELVIDASGDADVALLAGVPMQRGDDDGRNQPMSLRFNLGAVDFERVTAYFAERGCPTGTPPLISVGFHEASDSAIGDLVAAAVAEGTLEPGDLGYFQFFSMLGRPGELAFNCPRLAGFRADSAADRSRAWIVGRRKIRRITTFLQRHVPGFEASYLVLVASLLGVRESRRIVGEYVLSEDDWLACRKFDDGIGRNRYPIDIHNPSGTGTVLRHMAEGEWHDIPYRSLIPLGVEGLLVAGRCLSASFAAQASVRVEANCRSMGQAAGEAAVMATRGDGTVRGVDVAALRERLRAGGALL